ncbi:PocR ligand-binding domain-containing protein [Sediminispirochaeta smaragdinae]|uniref:histidine kinase n=1 Tax=Sediminispirochaeta smaragdinae (strain DSM 11293 / JCM 15392 / SEBR 4228) TaxID=573413 RepID=E1R0Y3_SEDSS|nr:PocR ligand-binding domain-containing protein [Sediminispirochaeta smaragdinae]ADK80232.1 PAS/PAC sensor signal transduction histidine kinase [Sediminispirochaeta smaragdinae DSM 11293]
MTENLQLLELVEKEQLDEVLRGFTQITGVSSFIISPEGEPISEQYNWTHLCSDYCRSTEKGKQLCYKSDRYGAEMSAKLKKRVSYTCLNAGLIDCTSPIIVGNYHIASFMCGQILYKPIDEDCARRHACAIGIKDLDGYLQAVSSIPIISPERMDAIVDFLQVITRTISELAWNTYVHSKQTRRYLDRIINMVSDGIVSIDTQGRISMANDAVGYMTGFNKHEIIGQDFSEFLGDDDSLSTYEKMLSTVREKGHGRAAIQLATASDKKIPVQVSFDKDKEQQAHLACVAVLRDVSQEFAIEQLKEDLIGMMTHDLKNPVFSIQKAMQLLSSGVLGTLNPEQDEVVRLSLGTTQQLSRMVMDYLDIYQHENGELRLRKEILDMRTILRQSIDQIELIAQEKDVAIVYNPPTAALNFMGDRLRLIRICLNLLENAIKFSPFGGTIHIESRYVSPRDCPYLSECLLDREKDEQHYVLTEMSDQGPGIKKGAEYAIFDKFSTSRCRDSCIPGGGGLGLAFCKLAVTAHHGVIGVASPVCSDRKGELYGSRFYFLLPADTKIKFQTAGIEL